MKKVAPFMPYVIASAAILAGFYFLWYMPRKKEQDAKNAVLQAEQDAKLQADDPLYEKLKNASTQGTTAVPGSNIISIL